MKWLPPLSIHSFREHVIGGGGVQNIQWPLSMSCVPPKHNSPSWKLPGWFYRGCWLHKPCLWLSCQFQDLLIKVIFICKERDRTQGKSKGKRNANTGVSGPSVMTAFRITPWAPAHPNLPAQAELVFSKMSHFHVMCKNINNVAKKEGWKSLPHDFSFYWFCVSSRQIESKLGRHKRKEGNGSNTVF